MSNKSVGMIGLGLLGAALAQRLLDCGYTVWVHNRTREKAEPLIARGAFWADNPLEECERIMISLYTTDTVVEVLDRLGGALRPGQILIDTTTGEPRQTAELGGRLAARGIRYLDAPVSGSSEQARRGEVTSIVGGDREAFDACRDLFDCCSSKTIYAGPVGSGAKMKLVSNLVLGLNRAALAEGLIFSQALGLEGKATLQMLLGTMAYSRIMDTKGQKMIDGNFLAQARLSQHLKDLRLILQTATEAGQALPLTETHRHLLEIAEAAGFGDADNSAVIEAFTRLTQTPQSRSSSSGLESSETRHE